MKKSALERLREMSREPVRSPMSRGVQYPSLAQQHLADEQEVQRLRVALAEAVAEIDRYQKVTPYLNNLLVWAELHFVESDNHYNDDLLDRLDEIFRYRT